MREEREPLGERLVDLLQPLWLAPLWLAPLVLAGAAVLLHSLPAGAQATAQPGAAGPRYVVEPCCNLCPKAQSKAAYKTSSARKHRLLMQGQDGWLFASEDDLRASFGPPAEAYAGLRRLAGALRARGVELVVVYPPTRGLMHHDKLPAGASFPLPAARASYSGALQKLRDAGIVVPPLDSLLDLPADHEFFFRADHHWTPYGAQRTAQLVAEQIKALPAWQGLPKKRFQTQRTGLLAKKGSLHKVATELCGFGFPDQYVDRYQTTPAEGEGASGIPPVSVIGSSNAAADYNFGGFLAEQLGVDVLTQTFERGGAEAPLLGYLPGEEFQKTPPKVLVWELDGAEKLPGRAFYRQLVPLVYGGCRGRSSALSKKVALQGGTTSEVLFNGGDGTVKPLLSRRHVLDLKFSDPSIREVKATVWYTNGSKETISQEYSKHADTRGRFVTELRDDGDWGGRTFMSLDRTLPEAARPGLTVDARLCARDEPSAPQRTATR